MCEATAIEAGISRIVYGGESFPWIRDVKYGKSSIKISGPVLNKECRGIFIEKLKEKGRNDILGYEDT